MIEFNKLSDSELQDMAQDFKFCISSIRALLGDFAFSKHSVKDGVSIKRMSSFNAAVYDAITVGFSEANEIPSRSNAVLGQGGFSLKDVNFINEEQRLALFEDPDFFAAVSGSVNDSGKIRTRVSRVLGAI